MKNTKPIFGWVLGIWSAYMTINGLMVFYNTSGPVQGSEFGMLITLASQFSQLTIWVALFAFWSLSPSTGKLPESVR